MARDTTEAAPPEEKTDGAPDTQQDGKAHESPTLHPKLDKEEQREVEERSSPGAQIVYGAIQKEGEEELERSSSALAWSGLAAGLAMGFSLLSEGVLRHHLPDAPWRPLLSKFGYSMGFLLVILGRQQLFTENTLTPILPLLNRRDGKTLSNVLRLWGVVLAANLLGALAFGWVLGNTSLFEAAQRQTFIDISRESLAGDFGTTLLRGIFAGWLIALMVWMLPAAETARLWVVILLTYLVGLAGFTHVIAGAVEMFLLATTGTASWGEVIGGYLLPTLIGNVIGGVTLVAALNHAQVVSGPD